jgi:hypothetical protein
MTTCRLNAGRIRSPLMGSSARSSSGNRWAILVEFGDAQGVGAEEHRVPVGL